MNHERKIHILRRKEQVPEKSAAAHLFIIQPIGGGERRAQGKMCFSNGEGNLFILCDPAFPCPVDVHTVMTVEDVRSALPTYLQGGYTLVIAPLMCCRGICAVLQDEMGVRMCLLARSR